MALATWGPFHIAETLAHGGARKRQVEQNMPIYSKLRDVGRVLGPANYQRPPSTPVLAGPLAFRL